MAATSEFNFNGKALQYQVTPMSADQHKAMSKSANHASKSVNALLNSLRDRKYLYEKNVQHFLSVYNNIDYRYYIKTQYYNGNPFNIHTALTDQSKSTGKDNILLGSNFFKLTSNQQAGTMTHETFHVLSLNPDDKGAMGFTYYDAQSRKWYGYGLNEAVTDLITNKAMLMLKDGFGKQVSQIYQPFIPIAEWFYKNYGDSMIVYYLFNDTRRLKMHFDAYENNGFNNFNALLDEIFDINIQKNGLASNANIQKAQRYLANVKTR